MIPHFAKILSPVVFAVLSGSVAAALPIYSTDFGAGDAGDSLGAEWSTNTRINRTPSGEKFLGGPDSDTRFGLSNDAARLTLNGLPAHAAVTVSFKLYVINAWTGGRADADGVNIFEIKVAETASSILKTTFSNASDFQHYPASFGAALSPPQSGASAVNSLGFGNRWNGDSTYDLEVVFSHSDSVLDVSFEVTGLVGYGNLYQQSWGLDDLSVSLSPIPEPSAYALMLSGFGLLGLRALRRSRS